LLPVVWIIPTFTTCNPTLQVGKHSSKKVSGFQSVLLVRDQLWADVKKCLTN
jgi:hypothetical protein